MKVHEDNKNSIQRDEYYMAHYDIVFYGDDLVENLNGKEYGDGIKQGGQISSYFQKHFTRSQDDDVAAAQSEETDIDCLALGITGDSVRRLLSFSGRRVSSLRVSVF